MKFLRLLFNMLFKHKKFARKNSKISEQLVKIANKIPTTGETVIVKFEDRYYKVREVVGLNTNSNYENNN